MAQYEYNRGRTPCWHRRAEEVSIGVEGSINFLVIAEITFVFDFFLWEVKYLCFQKLFGLFS